MATHSINVVAQAGSAVSTGEWIVIGLAIFFGLFAVAEALIAWLAYRRSPTRMRSHTWRAERHNGRLHILGTVSVSPGGTSFMLMETKCLVRPYRGKAGVLAAVKDHSDAPLEGPQVLDFEFVEESPPPDKMRYPQKIPFCDAEIWIKLMDGASLHDLQRGLVLEADVISLQGRYDPNRNIPEMLRYLVLYLARRQIVNLWKDNLVTRTWRRLKYG